MAKLFEDKKNEMVESQTVVSNENVKEDSMKNNEISFKLGDVDCFEDNDTIWFKLADIGRLLELSDSSVRKMKHDKWFDNDEISIWNPLLRVTGTVGDGVSETYVSESALYRILNRSNSSKAKPFERWVTKEVIPSIRKTGSYAIPTAPQKTDMEIRNETRKLMNEKEALKIEKFKLLREIAKEYESNKTYKQIMDAYAVKEMEGSFVLPLPVLDERNYSATEVGKILGISSNKVGKLANEHNLKTEEYGKWYVDKSRYSNKEVNTFRYNQKAIDALRSILDKETE